MVPAAIVGTDRVMPLGATQMTPGPVTVTFGEPIEVAHYDSARDLLAAAHRAIAQLLPEPLQPLPDTPPLV